MIKKTEPKRYPRASERYCIHCRQTRKFEYIRGLGHSRCIYCGGWETKEQPLETTCPLCKGIGKVKP